MSATFDLFVPTRKRPRNVDRLLGTIEETASDPSRIKCYFRVDSDDSDTLALIPSLRARHPALTIHFIVGERLPLAWHYTGMANLTHGDILWSGGDDIAFRTKGWDDEIEAEFAKVPDRIVLVYGNDCLQEHRLATHPFISRESFNVLGYFYPNTGEISVTDVWLHHAYQTIGRIVYRPDIITEHIHWLRRDADGNRLADYDQTYAGQYEKNYPEVMAVLQANQDRLVRGINVLLQAIGNEQRVFAKYPVKSPDDQVLTPNG